MAINVRKIKAEVMKQFNLAFWLLLPIHNGLLTLCLCLRRTTKSECAWIRDLNRASPKDDFPLPHIDILVDNTTQHKVFSFIDGFLGYNQIKMAPKDMEKTTFVTQWGTFCYKVVRIKECRGNISKVYGSFVS